MNKAIMLKVASAALIGSSLIPLATFAKGNKDMRPMPNDRSFIQSMVKFFENKQIDKNDRIVGSVTVISGTTITVLGKDNIVYVVDASKAKISGNIPLEGASTTIADIKVGDTIAVIGSRTGTNVVAKKINDQSIMQRTFFRGEVTAVSGNTVTIKTKDNIVYTVDATSAKIGGFGRPIATIVVSDIKVGDNVAVIGSLSGSNIIAKIIVDFKVDFRGRVFGHLDRS